ncbi:MAG: phosphoenolpyruvate--protein phosphotransferase [Candidatus Omnitrophota bacterium]
MKLTGIPASPGVAIGRVYTWDSDDYPVPERQIKEQAIPNEVARFEDALIKTRAEVLVIQKKISQELGVEHAQIFNAHLLVLEDRSLIEEVITTVKKQLVNVEFAFSRVLKRYSEVFSRMEDEYIKERSVDIQDVGKRVIRNLLGKRRQTLKQMKGKAIVVACNLSPSDTALMQKEQIIGFVTEIGGRTSHTAIMARSLEIPAVVGLEGIAKQVKSGDILIVDGQRGEVIINPDTDTLRSYEKDQKKYVKFEKELTKLKTLPAVTKDGKKVGLAANIELPEEISSVIAHGAEGIGLYRTEYIYLARTKMPLEEEHFVAYRQVAEKIAPHSVIIRTMDLGGDKFISQLDVASEMNPFLGWRAIRFSLARPEIFKIQLRGILRASVYGRLKIMYPMISGVTELRQANKILEEVKHELRTEGVKFDENIEVGAMIEIPSAAITCDVLAKEVDFFSIGTNDLIQYALAVDRINEKVAYLYEPAHPAVLRLIQRVIEVGHANNLWVGMCGEMTAELHLVVILLGMGLDEFSTSAVTLPVVKKVIRSITMKEAKKIADHAMQLSTGQEIEKYAREKLRKLVISKVAV